MSFEISNSRKDKKGSWRAYNLFMAFNDNGCVIVITSKNLRQF
jgi:hypothetical protein